MTINAPPGQKRTTISRKLTIEQRARSVPYKRPFVWAITTTLLFYLGIIAFLTSGIAFCLMSETARRGAAVTTGALLPICALLWITSYLKRRKATCPLCKCTPFLDNLARKHKKSFKIWPFNYGTTAILNTLLTQRWRCMYCGTPFDILKPKKNTTDSAYKNTDKK